MSDNKKPETKLWVRILNELISVINYIFIKSFELFYRFKAWFFKQKYVYRHHLEIYFDQGQLGFNYLNHHDYVKYKEKKIREWQKELGSEDFIYNTLSESYRHCNFVEFKSMTKPDKKIRFWVADRNIFAYWDIKRNKVHKKNKYAMLGVLNELGITKNQKNNLNIIHPNKYDIPNKNHYEINFGKDKYPATMFVEMIFKEIFKEDTEYIKVHLG